jgi:hypothetical protein
MGTSGDILVCGCQISTEFHPLFPQMIDLGPPQILYTAPDDTATALSINACQPPFLHIVGAAGDCQKDTSTFRLDVEQYITYNKDAVKNGTLSSSAKPFTSFLCRFPDSPKYKQNKPPMPYNRRFVAVNGFLSGVKYVDDNEERGIELFLLDIDNIVFTGQYMPSTTTSANTRKSMMTLI